MKLNGNVYRLYTTSSSAELPTYNFPTYYTFRPTAKLDLRQLLIVVLFEGKVRLRQFLGQALRLRQARGPSAAARTG